MRLTMPWNTTQQNHNGNGHSGKLEELRAALSKEVDHVARVAAQLSQELGAKASAATSEAGTQAATAASDVAREAQAAAQAAAKDVQANASGIASKIVEGAVALGPTIALMGRKRAEMLANDVQSIGQDLRRVRLTTEPRRMTPDYMPGITLLGGFGAGIALMYFLDPERGQKRRAMLRDQLSKWTRVGSQAAALKAKELRDAAGAAIEARKTALPIEPEVDTVETTGFETYAFGSNQTPESPAYPDAERETTSTIS